ncbi:ATP-binding cassette domain-containing protein [Suttonella sp. R2A3]|uniref:iron ABC transporter ATP-binding protein n=1 Tax=Suttonella sp. R2A3 TaxID=2908648 RepID=UPI001F224CB7|nr:ATP-binding cassette domain-containing protein [Suttonella sp. R2A3]UJF25072.1 ATP-binding cassette domain-containing protein [Suttonella sp. R2A3]
MIHVKQLHHTYAKHPVLQDISLNLPKQQLSAIIGPNGAGKSTLLRLIARLEPLQQGDIFVDGLDIRHTDSDKMAQKMAILQQHTHFLSRLSIDDLLMFARYPYHKGRPRKEDYQRIEEICAYFQLNDYRNRFIDELSGGQRQRALVAMVFAQDTDIILLDEPLNNLDMFHARQLMQTLRLAVDDWGKTITIVLHDINYAARYADYITALRHGRVFVSGYLEEVLTEATISELYGVDVEIITHHNKPLCVHF